MTDIPAAAERTLSPEELALVDQVCDDFEDAWKKGPRPDFKAVLDKLAIPLDTPVGRVLLRELLRLDLAYRIRHGEQPTAREYQDAFSHQAHLIEAVFAEGATTPHTPLPNSSVADPAPPPALEPPAVPDYIGRYKVIRRLGGGAYVDVYLAHDGMMKREVAIKVPSARLLATDRAKEEFLREARSAARLQHEGIVRAYDFGETDGHCYIVYEFVNGESLAERIKPERIAADPLPPEEAAQIVALVAEALHYAHLQGMFHRDIKPANILLDKQGKPKVTDFGLAVREENLAGQRGILAGTLPYMSPEQVRREGHHIDGRTDIFSLGVVLYELLCGRRPFAAETRDELEDQILHREARPPRQVKDSIPPELERICLRALSKRVNERYTTAKDMAEELSQLAEGVCYPKRLESQVVSAQERHGPEPLAALVIASGAEERTHPLTKDRVAIGRSPDCDIVLKGISVARYHAQLVRDGSHYLVEDLQSSNGTYVNGYQIRGRVPLKDNDRIHLGGTILVYRRAIAPRLAAPPLDQNVQFS